MMMTGTACELNEINDDIFTPSEDTEQPPISSTYCITDRISNCLLTDLSRCGAALLLPVASLPSSPLITINILSPDNSEEVLAVLLSEQRWLNENHTEDFHKVGVKFINTSLSDVHAIDALIQLFMLQKISCLKCDILVE
jgi:c-di-GMP-binding flagellar brake protein YcgR